MVLFDLLTIAGIPTAVGASEAVHQQKLLDEEAEAPERQEPFYIDVYCDAQSRKKDEVHGAIIVLKDGKVAASLTTLKPHADRHSFDYGRKTPRPACRKLIQRAARCHTPSPAFSTHFPPRTSTSRIDPCQRRQYWALSALSRLHRRASPMPCARSSTGSTPTKRHAS